MKNKFVLVALLVFSLGDVYRPNEVNAQCLNRGCCERRVRVRPLLNFLRQKRLELSCRRECCPTDMLDCGSCVAVFDMGVWHINSDSCTGTCECPVPVTSIPPGPPFVSTLPCEEPLLPPMVSESNTPAANEDANSNFEHRHSFTIGYGSVSSTTQYEINRFTRLGLRPHPESTPREPRAINERLFRQDRLKFEKKLELDNSPDLEFNIFVTFNPSVRDHTDLNLGSDPGEGKVGGTVWISGFDKNRHFTSQRVNVPLPEHGEREVKFGKWTLYLNAKNSQ